MRRGPLLESVVLCGYDLLARLLVLLALPVFLLHPRLKGGLRARLGFFPRVLPRNPVWFHASSAGDVVALVPLVQRSARSGVPTLLTTWTASGEAMARRLLGEAYDTTILRAPFDVVGPVASLVKRLQPRRLVLECLEVWPRLIHCCHRHDVPIAVVNGRLSERSLRWYRRLRLLFEPCFRRLSLVCALDGKNAAHFIEAGVPRERVFVEGSSKHAESRIPEPQPPRRRLVLGSLHRQEQAILLPHLRRLTEILPDLELVIAPRYPNDAPPMTRALRSIGLRVELASGSPTKQGGAVVGVFVLDTIGMLADAYRGARVAFVGGSLVRRGGHNVVEAAAGGAFVITGPYVDNCQAELHCLQQAKVASLARDGEAFFNLAVNALTADDESARRTSEAATAAIVGLAAAGDRIANRLEALAVS